MIKKLYEIAKRIIIKIFKTNNDQIINIAKSMATIIAKETPNKIDDKLVQLINNNSLNLTKEQKINLAKKLTEEASFIPDIAVSFINNKFKIGKKKGK